MSDKTYPYIGTGSQSKVTVLFYGNGYGTVMGGCGGTNSHREGDVIDNWAECNFRNITREYLTNTYGKCESQEHVDFICKLAENINALGVNTADWRSDLYFNFYIHHGELWFSFHQEEVACQRGEKLIHLPLPPKENEMEEFKPAKPIYTKEMHERGERPPVGSYFTMNNTPEHFHFSKFNGLPCEVLALTEYEDGVVVTFNNEKEGFGALWHNEGMEPIPTIEDELVDDIVDHFNAEFGHCKDLAVKLTDKYNITPKGE